jgi:hypothetical protein
MKVIPKVFYDLMDISDEEIAIGDWHEKYGNEASRRIKLALEGC